MATEVGQIYFDLDVKDAKFNAGLNQAENRARSASGGIGSSFGSIAGGVAIGTLAVQGATMAFDALKGQVVDAFAQYQEGVRTQAQLNAVLKSTSSIAGVTANDVNNLASELMNLTGVDDEALVSAQNMMLTFTNVGKDIFPTATKAALDMATAMNGGLAPNAEDLQAKVILLGKALQDPDAGLGALKRVGVNVDELSKKFTDSMSIQEKQKLILKELNTEFGGSAEAMGKTLPGQINILKEKFNNFKQEAAGKLIDMLGKLVEKLMELWQTIKPYLIPAFEMFKSAFMDLYETAKKFWNDNKDVLIPVLKALAVIIGGVLLAAIYALVIAVRVQIFIWQQIINLSGILWGAIKALADVFVWLGLKIADLLIWIMNTTRQGVQFWIWFGQMTVNTVKAAFDWVANAIGWVGDKFWGIYHSLGNIMHNVYWAIRNPFDAVFNWIKEKVDWVVDKLKALSPFTRHSPSLVDQITKGTQAIKMQYGSMFDFVGAGALATGGALGASMVTNNSPATTTNSSEVHIGELVINDEASGRKVLELLNRNNALARKGMTGVSL